MKKSNDSFSVKELFSVFVPKLWLIVVVALSLALILGGYSAFIERDTYTSSSTLMVSKNSTVINSTDIDLTAKMVETYEVIIFSDNFLNKVILDIEKDYANQGWTITPGYIRGVLSVTQHGETEAFDISVTTPNDEMSLAIAKAVSENIRDELPDMLPYPDGVIYSTIIDPASKPMGANGKPVLRNVILGFVGGAVLSMVIIFVLSLFDVVIHDRKKIEDALDIPVLGVIPRFHTEEEGKK